MNTFDENLFRQTYDAIAHSYRKHLPAGSALNPHPALEPEPYEACLAAERHRQYWKPDIVKFALVAESHVYTDMDDLKIKIRTDRLPREASGAPDQYVRLIYCLGYGEPALLTESPKCPNRGTPYFWQLFAQCAGMGTPGMLSLQQKVEILLTMKQRGIWLADASIHACMNPRFKGRGKALDKRHNIEWFRELYMRVLHASWKYVRRSLSDGVHVWIVGKMVRDYLPADDLIDMDKWIYQPGAPLTTEEMRTTQQRQMKRLLEELTAVTGIAYN